MELNSCLRVIQHVSYGYAFRGTNLNFQQFLNSDGYRTDAT